MTEDGRQKAPRETAAGLEREGKPPRASGSPESKANPATQANMTDDRSSVTEQSIHAKSQTADKVTPEGLHRSRTDR